MVGGRGRERYVTADTLRTVVLGWGKKVRCQNLEGGKQSICDRIIVRDDVHLPLSLYCEYFSMTKLRERSTIQ